MAGETVPTVAESAYLIVETLRALRYDLMPTQGVGIAQVPVELVDNLGLIGVRLTDLAVIHREGTARTLAELQSHATHLNDIVASIGGVDAAIRAMDIKRIDAGVTMIIPDVLNRISDSIESLGVALDPLHADLMEIDQGVRFVGDGIMRQFSQLVQVIKDATGELTININADFEQSFELLADKLKEVLPQIFGPAPIVGQEAPSFLGAGAVQAQVDATEKILSDVETRSPGILGWLTYLINAATGAAQSVGESVFSAIEGFVGGNPKSLEEKMGKGAGGLGTLFLSQLGLLSKAGVSTPETVWPRVGACYLFMVALGMMAHGIAGVASLKILGSGGAHLSGMAKFVGILAGFGPLANAVQGTIFRNFIGVPLSHWTNQMARPYLPSVGDAQRFRYKRVFNPSPYQKNPPRPPNSYDELMAYWGYSQEWIDVYENDLFREPMARDLLMMAEVGEFTDDWWEFKVMRLGYDPEDAPLMVKAFKRRAARTQLNARIANWRDSYVKGYCTEAEYRAGLADTNISQMAIDFAVQAGDGRRERIEKDELVTNAKAAYGRDVLTDEEFEALLDTVFKDPKVVDRVVKLERLKRFRRVNRMTAPEQARKILPLLKQQFLRSQLTEHEYRAAMLEAGLEGDVVDLTLEFDSEARDRLVMAEWQRYQLPALRDQVLHGLISVGDYRLELKQAGFPDEHLDAAAQLVIVQLARRVKATVRAGELPAYQRAYVIGIIDLGTLAAAYEDAGVDPGTIAAQRTILDFQRANEEDKRIAAAASIERQRLDKERADTQREKTEREREQQRRQREAQRASADANRRRAAAAAQQAKALAAAAAARRPRWPAEIQRISTAIERAYKDTGGLLPDDVWQFSLDLEDAIAVLPEPDAVRVDALIGRIERALARHAGIVPTPSV